MSTTARSERPISRWISVVRPSSRPAATSRGLRSPVEAGQHPVLGGHPALAAAAHPAGHVLVHRRGADHARAAHRDQRAAVGGLDEARDDVDRAELGRVSSVGAHRASLATGSTASARIRSAAMADTPRISPPSWPAPSTPSCSPARASPPRAASPTSARPGGVWEEFDPMEVASMPTFLSDPGALLALPPPAHRHAARRRAQPGPPRGRRDGAARHREGRDHPEHRRPARGGRHAATLIEMHGGLDRGMCLRCGARIPFDELVARADAADDGVPRLRLRLPHEERRRHVRREPAGRGDRGRLRPRRARRRDARGRQLAAGGAGQPAARHRARPAAGPWPSSPRARRPTTTGPPCACTGAPGCS